MDTQISGVGESRGGDMMDLLGSSQDRRINGASGGTTEEILANYDFRPIRRSEMESHPPHAGFDETTSRISRLGVQDSSKFASERSRDSRETLDISAIDGTVKKYVDVLMHSVEGISSRVSQLESRTRKVEHALDELRSSIGSVYGATDGKLRQLDHDLSEVSTGLQFIRNKQELAEAQSQLSKLQSEADCPPPLDNSSSPPAPYPLQAHLPLTSQQPAQPQATPQLPTQPPSIPQLPAQPSTTFQLPAHPPAPNAPPQVQLGYQDLPVQYSELQAPPQHYSLPPQQTHMPSQPFQSLPSQQSQKLSQKVPEHLSPPSYPVTQPPQLPAQPSLSPPTAAQPPAPNAPPQILLAHQNPPPQYSEFQYYSLPPQQNWMPTQPFPLPPQQNRMPTQPFPLPPQQPEEPQSPSSYMLPLQTRPVNQPPQPLARHTFPYQVHGSATPQAPGLQNYGSFPDHTSGPQNYPPAGPTQPNLPTAQLLPQARPIAAESGSSSQSAKRVPVDDVIEKVTVMGFPKELVKETVKRMTENGQSVDLNVVLDKLMNGQENQPRKGWFGEG